MKNEAIGGQEKQRDKGDKAINSSPSLPLSLSPSLPPSPRRIFISTGEVSGDLQGALLIPALQRQAAMRGWELEIAGLGGDRMAAAGAKILGHTTAIGSIGLLEALPYILPTFQIQRQARQYLRQYPPDLVVLIDYMGGNVRIGNFLRRQLPHVPIVYYIAPQAWVWSPSPKSAMEIAHVTDLLLAIFPEEARYFEARQTKSIWVGHPLVDRMVEFPSRERARAELQIESDRVAIALLPASRPQEVKYLLPVIFQAARAIQEQMPAAHFWIPLSLERYRQPIESAIANYGLRATLASDRTPEILAAADLAIGKSGTVNLELALLDVPQVAIYRVHPLTYWVARTFFNFSIPFMSPANLVSMQPIVPELLQERATPENIAREALALLVNPERRSQILQEYQEMRFCLGATGVCDRAAQEILQLLGSNANEA
jgi:lipid-A-disaccharide synthase